MMFFWVILFVATFLGCIALIFYATIALNDLEKSVGELGEAVIKRYGKHDD